MRSPLVVIFILAKQEDRGQRQTLSECESAAEILRHIFF
jgi:hypothetical protein